MNARALRPFAPALRELERNLSLPLPQRVRILRELEYDLEELQRRFRDEGLTEQDARRKALEALVPDASSLHALDSLHAPLYRRITRGVTQESLRRWEQYTLAASAALVVGFQALALLRTDLFSDPSPFLWAVLGFGGILLAAILAKVFQLWIKGDHASLHAGLGAILVLACATLLTGVGGAAAGVYELASALERAPELAGLLIPHWLVRDASLLAVALVLSLFGGLAWFVLNQWMAALIAAHREALNIDAIPPAHVQQETEPC